MLKVTSRIEIQGRFRTVKGIITRETKKYWFCREDGNPYYEYKFHKEKLYRRLDKYTFERLKEIEARNNKNVLDNQTK